MAFHFEMAFQFEIRTRVVFGEGRFQELAALARELGFRRTLLVADRGMAAAGYAGQAAEYLASAGAAVFTFQDFDANPDTAMIEAGRVFAASRDIDSLVGLGGGSKSKPTVSSRDQDAAHPSSIRISIP